MLKVGDKVIIRNPYKGFPTYLKDTVMRIDDLGVILYSGMCLSDDRDLQLFDEDTYQKLLDIDTDIKALINKAQNLVTNKGI